MRVVKMFVGGVAPLGIATACCGYDHDGVVLGAVDCRFSETPVAWDDTTGGSSPADELEPYVGTFSVEGAWADGAPTAVEVTLAPGDGEPVRLDVVGGGDADLCTSGLSIPVRVGLTTAGGELAFDAEATWDATGEGLDLWLVAPLDQNGGTYEPSLHLQPNEEPAGWRLSLSVDAGPPTGELALDVTGEDESAAWDRSAPVLGF
ncbi:MAG: hypothetical protein ABMA64_03380 [Myxococcota bacterium]